jgi:Zn-dependent oligopeptidase
LADSFLPPPAGTVPAAAYDAGSYGYVWADMIGMDLATAFKRAVGGSFDTRAGRRLRNEIYARGSSRDANESVEVFLGRKQSAEPFWKTLGLR